MIDSILGIVARAQGVLDALRSLLATGLDFIEARGELLAAEWAQEKRRLFDALLGLALAVLFCATALVLLIACLLWTLPAESRPLVCGVLSAVLLLAGVWALRRARGQLADPASPWRDSRAELRRDFEGLRADPLHHRPGRS